MRTWVDCKYRYRTYWYYVEERVTEGTACYQGIQK